jgi:uncharacterized small protein (DUF1192 family)
MHAYVNLLLKAQVDDLKQRIDSTPLSVLTQALLNDKNEEIDELTAEVERLNAELELLRTTSQSSEVCEVQLLLTVRNS